jgi:hypothetical protein
MLKLEESLHDLRKDEKRGSGDEREGRPGENTDSVDFGANKTEGDRQSPGRKERPRPV